MKKSRNKKARRRVVALISLGVLCLVAAVVIYRYVAFNMWVSRDAGRLSPYERFLIKDGERVFANDPAPDAFERRIEIGLVRHVARDRIVVNMSRSEIRRSFFGDEAYVKIFLETALPRDRSKTTSIKFLCVLQKRNDAWRFKGTQDLSIE